MSYHVINEFYVYSVPCLQFLILINEFANTYIYYVKNKTKKHTYNEKI